MVQYRILKVYVKHGVIVDKIHEIISCKQSKWLDNYINFNTQQRNRARKGFEKDFYKLPNNAFYGKAMENVRNRLRLEFIKKHEYKEFIKQQSKIKFNGILEPFMKL